MDRKFEENYFKKHYAKITGGFTHKDLKKNKNWYKGWFDFINKYIPVKKGKGKVSLEIGCAIAAPSSILSGLGYKAYATDISEFSVKKAARLSPQIDFAVWDVQKKGDLPFNIQFDLIIGFEVIEHLKLPEVALKNLHTLLNKKGWLVLSTPYPYKKSFEDPTHLNVRYPREWKARLQDLGFENIIIKEATFIPYLYKYNSFFSFGLPFGISSPYINSTVFLLARK